MSDKWGAPLSAQGVAGIHNSALPEQWGAAGILASASNVVMGAQVSTTSDELAAIRPGFVTGLAVKLTAPVTTGTVTVTVTKNGTPGTLQLVLGSGQDTGHIAQEPPLDPFVADDLIGLIYSTSGDFTPVGSIDVAAWLQTSGSPNAPLDFTSIRHLFTAAQDVAPVALSYGANIATNAALSNVFTVTLSDVTAQLDNPSNLVDGQTIIWRITQDGTGGRALTFGANFDFGTAGAPDLTTSTSGKMDIITGVSNGSKIFCSAQRGFTP